jgi:hypothetical protein
MRFEDSVGDQATSVRRIGDFLSVPVDLTRIRADRRTYREART